MHTNSKLKFQELEKSYILEYPNLEKINYQFNQMQRPLGKNDSEEAELEKEIDERLEQSKKAIEEQKEKNDMANEKQPAEKNNNASGFQ